jgi:hypothetical protein
MGGMRQIEPRTIEVSREEPQSRFGPPNHLQG